VARVLIAEDDPLAAEVLTAFLEHCGHEVARAESGAEALEMSGRARPEVLICDHWLRGLDGPSLARQLRRASPDLRVLITSGAPETVDPARGAKDLMVLSKPLDLEQLERHLG